MSYLSEKYAADNEIPVYNKTTTGITQLYRGDKLVNMLTLAKFQRALKLEFEISEKKSYKEKIREYTPTGDGQGV